MVIVDQHYNFHHCRLQHIHTPGRVTIPVRVDGWNTSLPFRHNKMRSQ